MVDMLLCALLGTIAVYLCQLKSQIKELGVNPNFNVLTRTAGLNICRRSNRGKNISVVTFDVAQMGKHNSLFGEQWVNAKISSALTCVRKSLRKGDIISQLNSGDEFFIIVRTGDEEAVITKVVAAFSVHWPGGIYISSAKVDNEGILPAIQRGMETVYQLKKEKKE